MLDSITASRVKYVVCPECEGEGTMGTLGAYTADEVSEDFLSAGEYADLHAASLAPCECCHGKRVATSSDIEHYKCQLEAEALRRAEAPYLR